MENPVFKRRNFFKHLGIAGGAVAAASVSRVAMSALPELVIQTKPDTMPPMHKYQMHFHRSFYPKGLLLFPAGQPR